MCVIQDLLVISGEFNLDQILVQFHLAARGRSCGSLFLLFFLVGISFP